MSRSNLADIELHLHHETEMAYLVSDSGDSDDAVWLPKSQVERNEQKRADIWEFTMPQWLAEQKGLV